MVEGCGLTGTGGLGLFGLERGCQVDIGHEAMSMGRDRGRGVGRGLAGHAWLHLDCTVL